MHVKEEYMDVIITDVWKDEYGINVGFINGKEGEIVVNMDEDEAYVLFESLKDILEEMVKNDKV